MEAFDLSHPETALNLVVGGVLLFLVLTWSVRIRGLHPRDEPTRWMVLLAVTGLHCQMGRFLVLAAQNPDLGFLGVALEVTAAGLVAAFGVIYSRRLAGRFAVPLWDSVLIGLSGTIPVIGLFMLRVSGASAVRVEDVWGRQVWTIDAPPWTFLALGPLFVAAYRALVLVARVRGLRPAERRLCGSPVLVYTFAGMADLIGTSARWWYTGFFPFAFLYHAYVLDLLHRMRVGRLLSQAEDQALELEQQKVVLDQALAESNASREVRLRFVANVSHELRTPVHGILGLSSLLADTNLDAHQRELLNHLSVSGRALRLLIDDILDYAKIEAGKVEVRPDWEDPRRLVGDVLATVAHAAFHKGLGLEGRFGQDVPVKVHTDAQRLRQILLNLVGNAIKFTEHGHVTVRVRLRRSHERLGVFDCEVRDTGMGMAKERIPQLFDPFVQENAADNRLLGGSGLGLAISRDLARALGGELTAESELGRGSVFRVRVPVGLQAEPDPWRLPIRPGTRVLVIDWDGLLRFAIEPMLQSARAEVTWRRSVADVTPEETFDIILDGALALAHMVDKLRKRCNARWITCPALDERVRIPERVRPDATVYRPIIPERLAEVLRSPEPVAAAAPHADTEGFVQPLNILVVDDNAVNLIVACRIVEALGHKSFAARDGLLALDMLDSLRADLILMDCQMPGIDGYETTRRIRARHGTKHRILALTAATFDQDRSMATESGMDGMLEKPIDLDRLREVLGRGRADGTQDRGDRSATDDPDPREPDAGPTRQSPYPFS
jgi:signal transduction histidine kinase/CheY-like chemotaxis protein